MTNPSAALPASPPNHWPAALVAHLAGGENAVLVTVARSQGSVPREAGASMVIGAHGSALTIGGGHLEWQAIAHARRLLATPGARPEVSRYNLGARLGQCCGGVVWLLYEVIPAAALSTWQLRCQGIDGGARLQRTVDSTAYVSTWNVTFSPGPDTSLQGGPEQWTFQQEFVVDRFPVWIFGAGHVAQALVRQLQPLGAAITWIDSRDEAFAECDTQGMHARVTDTPESEIAHAPPGTYFLIMTHSHTLDFALCEAIYARRDFAYFGLIGSRSKRASFERRLLDRGLAPDRLGEMTCPIGIPGIVSKLPAGIALSVAAELFQIHNTRQLLTQAGRPRLLDSTIQPE